MRNNLDGIVRYLKFIPSASRTLSRKFIEKGWLHATDSPPEELVTLVLGMIEHDVNQYGEFITMLYDIEGMDLIVGTLTGMPYDLLSIFSYLWEGGRRGGREGEREGGRGKEERKERRKVGEGGKREGGKRDGGGEVTK